MAVKKSGLAHSLLVGHKNEVIVNKAKILLNLSPPRLPSMRDLSSLMVGYLPLQLVSKHIMFFALSSLTVDSGEPPIGIPST